MQVPRKIRIVELKNNVEINTERPIERIVLLFLTIRQPTIETIPDIIKSCFKISVLISSTLKASMAKTADPVIIKIRSGSLFIFLITDNT